MLELEPTGQQLPSEVAEMAMKLSLVTSEELSCGCTIDMHPSNCIK